MIIIALYHCEVFVEITRRQYGKWQSIKTPKYKMLCKTQSSSNWSGEYFVTFLPQKRLCFNPSVQEKLLIEEEFDNKAFTLFYPRINLRISPAGKRCIQDVF